MRTRPSGPDASSRPSRRWTRGFSCALSASALIAAVAASVSAPPADARPASTSVNWKLRTDPAFHPSGPRAFVIDLLPSRKSTPWLMVGQWQTTASASPEPVVWTSKDWPDQRQPNWTRRPLPLPRGATGGTVAGVVQLKATTVAVGSALRGNDIDPIVWVSTNRTSWRIFGKKTLGTPGQQQLIGVAAHEDGFVAVGTETTSSTQRPFILRSVRNGYKRRSLPKVRQFLGIKDITSNGTSGVAIAAVSGRIGATRPFAWITLDGGENWVATKPVRTPGSADVTAIAMGSGGGVSLYGVRSISGDRALEVWFTADGQRWRNGRVNLIDRDTNDPRSPVGLSVADVSEFGIASIYDLAGRRSELAIMGNGSWELTTVRSIPGATDAAAGPLAYNGRIVLFVSNGGGSPILSIFDPNLDDWAEDVDVKHSRPGTFPATSAARNVNLIVKSSTDFGLLGIEYPVPTGAPGAFIGRPISWVTGAGADSKGRKLRVPRLAQGAVTSDSIEVGGRTFVFGSRPVTGANGAWDGAVWTYEAKGDLRPLRTTGLGGPGTQIVTGVARAGSTWVASGISGPDKTQTRDAMIWVSNNGLSWESALPPDVEGEQRAHDVCALGADSAIVVGIVQSDEGVAIPVAWVPGPNGFTMTTPSGIHPGRMSRCAEGPDGVVVVGELQGKPTLWKSVDGHAWTVVPLPSLGPGVTLLDTVAANENGYLVAGTVDDGTGYRDLAVWSWPAGAKPRRIASGPGFRGWDSQEVATIRLDGKRAILAGSSGPSARVWETDDIFGS